MTGYGRLQRQEALVGSEGIQKIKEVTLGIIGLSGNGSPLALGAGCAGVQNFKLFDQDKLDEPNLNRFFAGGVKHIEQYKVDLVKEDLTRLDPSIRCEAFRLDVRDPKAQLELATCDYIVACPDNDETRIFLQEFCTKRQIPLIEIGSGVVIADEVLRMFGCKMSFYEPGNACLGCISLDGEPMAQSNQSFVGINLVAAGVAVTTLVGYVTGKWKTKNFVAFDALNEEMMSMDVMKRPNCPFCGTEQNTHRSPTNKT